MRCSKKIRILTTVAILGAIIFPMMANAADDSVTSKTTIATSKKTADSQHAALVNGITIPHKYYEHQFEMLKQQVMRRNPGQLPDALKKKLKDEVMGKLIADELLFQHANKKGLKADPGAIDEELKKIKTRFKDEKRYQEQLKSAGLSEEQLKGQIKRQGIISKLIKKEIIPSVKVSDEEIKKYYDTNPDKFRQPEKVRASHILMKVEKTDDEKKKAAAKKKLQKIQKRILAGEDFGALAKEHSQGPSNVKGGDLGYFTRGRMVKAFENAAFKLAPNEVSDIVETKFGYHLIKVIDHQKASETPFEKIEPKIKSLLFNEQVRKKMEPYVKNLREKANVKVFIK